MIFDFGVEPEDVGAIPTISTNKPMKKFYTQPRIDKKTMTKMIALKMYLKKRALTEAQNKPILEAQIK